MTKNPIHEMLDQHIGGTPGNWYWEIELPGGESFGGGMFYRIADAREHMVRRLISHAVRPKPSRGGAPQPRKRGEGQ